MQYKKPENFTHFGAKQSKASIAGDNFCSLSNFGRFSPRTANAERPHSACGSPSAAWEARRHHTFHAAHHLRHTAFFIFFIIRCISSNCSQQAVDVLHLHAGPRDARLREPLMISGLARSFSVIELMIASCALHFIVHLR